MGNSKNNIKLPVKVACLSLLSSLAFISISCTRQTNSANNVSSLPEQRSTISSSKSVDSSATVDKKQDSADSSATVDKNQYLDDRSTPVEVLKSYYNAINRKEYVRAYYYWSHQGTSASSQPPAYPQFVAGYADTTSVQLTTGEVTTQGAAGSAFHQVPVSLVASDTNGSTHQYVGCYVIRQINPQIFGAPPFKPMGINSAKISAVPKGDNAKALMAKSCS